MTTPTSQRDHAESFPLFDWLRFVLASIVALVHQGIITWIPASNFAVQTFFALSGWLIGGILLTTSTARLPRFFFNRSVRIWIPYFVAVAAIYSLGAVRDGIDEKFLEFLFYDLTFTHNWFIQKVPEVIVRMPLEGTGAHFWSISVEEQFYLAAPIIMTLVAWGKSVRTWVAICFVMYFLQTWYAAVSLGVLASVARNVFGSWHRTPIAQVSLWLMGGSMVAVLIILPASYLWIAPILAITVVLLAAVEGARGTVGAFFGGMSYPLYLHHWGGMFVANGLVKIVDLPLSSIGWMAYVISLIIGSMAYFIVDRNIQRLRNSWYTPARGVVIGLTAYSLMAVGVLGGLS